MMGTRLVSISSINQFVLLRMRLAVILVTEILVFVIMVSSRYLLQNYAHVLPSKLYLKLGKILGHERLILGKKILILFINFN